MKRAIISFIIIIWCHTALLAQNSDNVTTNNSHTNKSSLPEQPFIDITTSMHQELLYPTIAFPGDILPISNRNNTIIEFDFNNSFRFRRFSLSPYNMRMINHRITDINNVGATLLWKSTSKISIDWSVFVSQQYGYTLNSVYTGLGSKMNLNYHFNSKLQLSVWGQYLLNYNNDPFVRASNSQPKNGIGIRLEYNPNMNTKISLDISKQEDLINSKKSAIQLEGKARIKF